MGYERLTASDDIDSGDGNAFDSIVAAQERRQKKTSRERKARTARVDFFSVAVVWYGDGTDSLFVLAARRARSRGAQILTMYDSAGCVVP